MAHGSPRINTCEKCETYITVSRFSNDPICPVCGTISVQTSKTKLLEKYELSYFFHEFYSDETNWRNIITNLKTTIK